MPVLYESVVVPRLRAVCGNMVNVENTVSAENTINAVSAENVVSAVSAGNAVSAENTVSAVNAETMHPLPSLPHRVGPAPVATHQHQHQRQLLQLFQHLVFPALQ